jgi:FAD/FMN-containing dehydrogenase
VAINRDVLAVPGEARYEEGRLAFNLAADQRPALVATPADEQAVAATIRIAGGLGLSVAAQTTGHGATALGSLESALLLRTDRMRGVALDIKNRRARVQSGVRWGEVLPEASAHGLSALHGSSPDVGVVGYTLGGGLSWYARKYGLAADHVLAIELVTADGEVRRVDAVHEPELFWALRGGGGHFGVVTALEFELVPVAELYAGALFFPWERSAEVLHAWREWVSDVPDELTSVGRILRFPTLREIPDPLRGGSFAIIELAYLGSGALGVELVSPLRRLGPVIDTVAPATPDAIAELHMDPRDPVPAGGGHRLLDDLPPGLVDELVHVAGPGSDTPLLSVELRHLGGALRSAQPGHGPMSPVSSAFSIFAVGLTPDEESTRVVRQRCEMIDHAVAPWASATVMPNFALEPGAASQFHDAQTVERLRAVRAEVDPAGLFLAKHAL